MIPAQIQKTARIPAVSRASSAMSASFVGVTSSTMARPATALQGLDAGVVVNPLRQGAAGSVA